MKVVAAAAVLALGALTACGDGVDVAGVDAVAVGGGAAVTTHEDAAVTDVSVAKKASLLVTQVRRWRELAYARQPDAMPECIGDGATHFDTPEAAMRYLARAWNTNDLQALCQVTNPNARSLLLRAHSEAVNLRLAGCHGFGDGRYTCTFRHDFPRLKQPRHPGRMWVDVAPARTPGYYMTVYIGCGG